MRTNFMTFLITSLFLFVAATAWGGEEEAQKKFIVRDPQGVEVFSCITEGNGVTCREGPCSQEKLLAALQKAERFLPKKTCPPNTICAEDYTLKYDVDVRSEAQKLRDKADEIEQREKDNREIRAILDACKKEATP